MIHSRTVSEIGPWTLDRKDKASRFGGVSSMDFALSPFADAIISQDV